MALNWLTAPGKSYVLEAQTSLAGKNWTAINTNAAGGMAIITNCSSLITAARPAFTKFFCSHE